jgi:2'-5' RNA ligase
MASPSRREAVGCSLWLVPEGEVRDTLAAAIEDLSRVQGGPRFEPHVTLLGGLACAEGQLLRAAERFAAGLGPFVIRLGSAAHQDAFFRCLFLSADQDAALERAHVLALEAFGLRAPRPFMPHLSLLYAELPEQARAALAAQIGRTLACAFEVATLEVHRTAGATETWRRLAAFALRGARVGTPSFT